MSQHLIHIGYPKAGSTFLQKWFELHPQLGFKHGGLGNFYNVYEVAHLCDVSYKYFVTSCEGLSMPNEDVGKVSFAYTGKVSLETHRDIKKKQARVCHTLKALYPDSHIIIVTRGFESMILSSYSQSLRMGSVFHLDKACEQLADYLKTDVGHYFDYDYLIKTYREAFGEESVIVLPYELLRDDQNKFLSVIEEKLGIEHIEMPQHRINSSLSPHELYWYPVISRQMVNVFWRLGPKAFRTIYTWYIHKTMYNKLRKPIKIFKRLYPERKITKTDVPLHILECCRGKANSLINHHLYAPYTAEYLWD